jgi:hypothetical protein
VFYFCRTRYSGAASYKISLQGIHYKFTVSTPVRSIDYTFTALTPLCLVEFISTYHRQQTPKILRASPSTSTSTHPRGLLGEITSVNQQHRHHIIFECELSCPSNRFLWACSAVIRPFCITILYHNLLLLIDIFHI